MPKLLLTFLVFTSVLLPVAAAGQASKSESSDERHIAALKERAGSGDPKAQVELGIAYASGEGVPADSEQAVKWFSKAAEQGDAAAEYSLSEMYLTGRGVNADFTEGLKWLKRSAEHGDPRGQSNLAALYLSGQGVPKDEVEAAKWMRKAADQGLAAGQFGMGAMYAHGRGVPQSETEAVTWYRKAAVQGDTPAMNNLALLLSTSSDLKLRDPNEAISFAKKAVDAEPNNPAYLDTLAMTHYEAGQRSQAVEAERRALALSPGKSSYKEALEKYEEAVSRH